MKKLVSFLTAITMILLLSGCGAAAKEADVKALAEQLSREVVFEADLRELSAEKLGNYLDLPEGAEAYAYMSNGNTAEEIITAKCASESDAQTLKASIEAFLADQRQEMQRYLPEEVARLEHAVLAQRGVYVALCVSADQTAAEQIIKENLG